MYSGLKFCTETTGRSCSTVEPGSKRTTRVQPSTKDTTRKGTRGATSTWGTKESHSGRSKASGSSMVYPSPTCNSMILRTNSEPLHAKQLKAVEQCGCTDCHSASSMVVSIFSPRASVASRLRVILTLTTWGREFSRRLACARLVGDTCKYRLPSLPTPMLVRTTLMEVPAPWSFNPGTSTKHGRDIGKGSLHAPISPPELTRDICKALLPPASQEPMGTRCPARGSRIMLHVALTWRKAHR
mmetsp:Transcript_2643/g.9575  ORF Transcript_2643/g.9575 Transcript_2643/m.9575 type:complete len:242 (-) Transcript_2643:11140-11865(-)